ncbi:MAG: MATE family efflux transporter [Eubacteriales bacterium]|nr:MATE family efflux transporter [Eubacteriales bacterium]
MQITLDSHFTYSKLVRFTLPSIYMMIFTSLYTIVDGFFVSNYVGGMALAAITLIFPPLMIIGAVGFMFGTGSTAIIGKLLGEERPEDAKAFFTAMLITVFGVGIAISVLGQILLPWLATLLGATGEIYSYSIIYGRYLLLAMPMFMMQNLFQAFFVVAEKPKYGFYTTLAAGVTNIVLDYVFIAVWHWGLEGAALATALGQTVGGIIPLFYFARKNTSRLQMVKPKLSWQMLINTCTNGISELLSSITGSVISVLYNYQLLHYIGANGIASYGVLMYVGFVFAAISIGYAIGSAPIISFHYGAQNHKELHNVYSKSIRLNIYAGIAMTVLSFVLAKSIAQIFVGYDEELLNITIKAMRIYALSCLLSGFNIFVSSFFTALSNGLISAVISTLRSLVFSIGSVLVLPLLFGFEGIWYSFILTDVLTFTVSVLYLLSQRKRYHY